MQRLEWNMDMLECLDKIAWDRLQHAYGIATDAPEQIRALAGDDDDQRDDAVDGFLLSSAIHQYTFYSATPYIIPFVIELLQHPDIYNRPVLSGSLKNDLLCFLQACSSCCQGAPEVEAALARGRETYMRFCEDEDAAAGDFARELLAFCEHHAVPAMPGRCPVCGTDHACGHPPLALGSRRIRKAAALLKHVWRHLMAVAAAIFLGGVSYVLIAHASSPFRLTVPWVVSLTAYWLLLREIWSHPPNTCPQCNYDFGAGYLDRCPECGTRIERTKARIR